MELFAEEEEGTHGMVETFVEVVFWGREEVGGGREGKGFVYGVEIEEVSGFDAVPHERVCETEERDDCAVDDLSLRTRVDFVFVFVVEVEGVGEVTAQLSGIDEDDEPLAAGKEG